MKFKALFTVLMFLGFVYFGTAYSPAKIIEVTDSFGNTYDVQSNFAHDGTFARITNDEQKIIVSDETEITLCITEVEHEEGREVEYYFKHSGHDFVGWQSDNCATFDSYSREDWTGNEWVFEIFVRDDSEITAKNSDVEGGYDFQFQPRYSNLVLPSESNKTTETTVYDTIRVSKSGYEDLQEKANDNRKLKDELDQKRSTINSLNQEIEEKNSTIEELNSDIAEKESTIQDMNSTINELRNKTNQLENEIGGLERGIFSRILSIF